MKAVIVEDSRLAREGLKKLLSKFSSISLVGEADSAEQGSLLVGNTRPDVIFLDIDMPGKDGFDMLSDIPGCPFVIFTTAYAEYAVRSFDFNTIDYLLKPIEPERFARAIEKLKFQLSDVSKVAILEEHNQVFLKDKGQSYLVKLKEIRLFESCGNYTRVIFENASPFIYKSLSKIESRLPYTLFFRANRQQIINLNYAQAIEESVSSGLLVRMDGGKEVEVSRGQAARLRSRFAL